MYLITFSLRIGKSIFHYFFDLHSVVRNYFLAILFCVGPSLWLYTRYLVTKTEVLHKRDYLHYLPFIMLLPICWLIPNNGPDNNSMLFRLFYDGIIVHMAIYAGYSFVWFKQKKTNYLQKEDTRLNTWINYFLGFNILFVLFYGIISKVAFPFYIGLSFLFSIMIVGLAIWSLTHPIIFTKPLKKYSLSNIDTTETKRLSFILKNYFEKEKPYLDPSLTLSSLSKQLNISSKELSQTINQQEQLNYSQFILKYRIAEAKILLISDTHKNMTIASIAYDSGFNSISSFNTAFKKQIGITPVEYQKQFAKS